MVLPAGQAQAATAEPFTYHFGTPQAIRTSGLSGDELSKAITDEVHQMREAKANGATINGMTSSTPPTSDETLIENLSDGAGGDTWAGLTVQANDETGRVYVAWLDDRNGGVSIYAKSSSDMGATWTAEKRIDKSSGTGDSDFSLNIATGGHGDVYLVWGDDRTTSGTQRLYYATSMDAGATWSTAAEISSTSDLVGLPNALVADGFGHVFVAWEDVGAGGTNIMAVRSSDYGGTWSGDVRINDVTGTNFDIGPIAVLDRSNDISVFWESDRAGGAGEDFYTARSTDNGATWSADTRLNANAAGTLDMDNWDAASDGNGGVHAFYTMSAAGAASDSVSAYSRSSTDYGKTWGGQKKLSTGFEVEETTFLFFFLFAGPIMGNATFDGSNHRAVLAFDGGPAPGAIFGDAMVTVTSNGGSSWSAPEKVDTDPTGTGEIGTITADLDNEGHVVVAYTDTRFGTNDVFINSSNDNGASWQGSDDKIDGAAAGSSTKTLTGQFFFFANLPGVEGGNNDMRSNFYVTYFDDRAAAPGLYAARVNFTNNDESLVRLSGANRVATGLDISQDSFPADGSVSAMVIATSQNFPDGLAAGPLANMVGGPVLLNPQSGLDSAVAAEIVRLWDGLDDGATDIYMVGGTSALSTTVEASIAALNSKIDVERISGATRIETAIGVAQTEDVLRGHGPSEAMVVTSENFPDALAASAPASDSGINGDCMPIVLTPRTALPSIVGSYLTGVSGTLATANIIGGTAAVSDAVKASVDSIIATTTRISGGDRYATATEVADAFYTGDLAPLTIGVATGLNFADALTGGAHSGNKHQPLILVRSTDVPTATVDYVTDNSGTIYGGFVYGGTSAISDGVKAYLESLL
ncbi:MAG: cell wall-binding repeat-containing protein [Candidatus Andersenbacteria bacterium]